MSRRRRWQRELKRPPSGGSGARVWPLPASMFLINVFGYAAIGGVLSLLLPTQVRLVSADAAPSVLALVTGSARSPPWPATGRRVALPRTRGRWGRRAPWILFGGLATAASPILLGAVGSVAGLLVGWFLVQGTVNDVLATIPGGSRPTATACPAPCRVWGWPWAA